MMRRLYDWIMRQAAGPHATPVLAFLSFLESSVFPIPPDVMLVPMCLANRMRAFFYAFVCTVSSVLGGLLGVLVSHAAVFAVAISAQSVAWLLVLRSVREPRRSAGGRERR